MTDKSRGRHTSLFDGRLKKGSESERSRGDPRRSYGKVRSNPLANR